ncbi:uncharacterized protein XM38_016990 [Halomicronema hongdechloris C2206]|uniref:DUF2267 domain-containing protein n=1 Tax=Halomicronema hongdechloris C2206 TaxID=1641165 RepID=A0A1Z3HKD3_9CYAN|nr:DUF2267 domain-containing protein [Halomicronema hongdechloris]ASC70753.1 uncharacterized protein XM38_016990 [Halomicronema hongdechloris C2206]
MTSANISDTERTFLEKVMQRANLPDIYDARDLTFVVFRTMRDMMTTEASERIQASFDNQEIANLWKDDNPIVSFLSKLRPPLEIDADTFLRRVQQEGSVPQGANTESVIIAVFSAAREELPAERSQEIAGILPEGLRVLWEQV